MSPASYASPCFVDAMRDHRARLHQTRLDRTRRAIAHGIRDLTQGCPASAESSDVVGNGTGPGNPGAGLRRTRDRSGRGLAHS
jgi:hypothetical protein